MSQSAADAKLGSNCMKIIDFFSNHRFLKVAHPINVNIIIIIILWAFKSVVLSNSVGYVY